MTSLITDDDQFFSKLELDEIEALDQYDEQQESKSDTTATATTIVDTTTSDNVTFGEFNDDDVMIIDDYVDEQVNASKRTPGHSKNAEVRKRERLKDEDSGTTGDAWTAFLSWFEKQQAFETPWFQSIPVCALNVSQCRSIVMRCKDWGHLTQFSRILLSFLKDDSLHVPGGDAYFEDIVALLELTFLRYEGELNSISSSSHRQDFGSIFEDVLQSYVSGKLNLGPSRIPELLTNVYPKAFESIMCTVVKSGNVELLLPICVNSETNFLKILKSLHSGQIFSIAGIFEDDPDFQNYSNPAQKLSTNLLDLLKNTLGCSFLKILPTKFQPIFCFDSVVCKNPDKLRGSEAVIGELYCLLNDLFCECSGQSSQDDEFLGFVLNMLPFTSGILNDKKLSKSVKFTMHPYLWIYVKKCGRFS